MCAGKSHMRLREKGGFNQSQTSESLHSADLDIIGAGYR
jgi:hypothetical protein